MIFGLNNDNLLKTKLVIFTKHDYVYSLRHTIFPISSSSNKYLFGFIASEINQNGIYFKEYTFISYINHYGTFFT